VPVAGAPGPFNLSEAPVLESMLRASGFSDVRVESRSATFELASVAEYLQIFSDVAWKHRIAALAESERRRLEEALTRAVQPFVQERGLRLPATSLCASGLKG
jgi:hypothetical protein